MSSLFFYNVTCAYQSASKDRLDKQLAISKEYLASIRPNKSVNKCQTNTSVCCENECIIPLVTHCFDSRIGSSFLTGCDASFSIMGFPQIFG